MNINGENIVLRAIEFDDLEFLREMLNDPEISGKVVGWSFPVSKAMQQKWFEGQGANKEHIRFIIESKDKQRLGLATLHSIDWKNRVAEHGIKLAKNENRRKGIGTDTVKTIARYAFDELNLHRLEATWLSCNKASEALFKKCGFTIEGCLREKIYKSGERYDLICAGITAQEYRQLAK